MGQLIPENVTKKIDSLGRVTLPKGLRDRFNLPENSELDISTGVIDGKRCICLTEPRDTGDEVQAAIDLLKNKGYNVTSTGAKKEVEDAYINDLKVLGRNFYKLIEVNLKEDTYFDIKSEEKVVYKSVKYWAEKFSEVGIYPMDRKKFLGFFDNESTNYWRRIYYRRLIENRWRWVCMELVPTDDEDVGILVVRDVEDYIADWRVQEKE